MMIIDKIFIIRCNRGRRLHRRLYRMQQRRKRENERLITGMMMKIFD